MQGIYSLLKYLILNYSPGPLLSFLKKSHYARKLKAFPMEREPELAVVSGIVNNRDHVIDIGSNIGVYTKFLSLLVGEHGRVYSVEPVPETYSILSSNIRNLGLKNVTSINRAVSDSDKPVTMCVPRYYQGADNFYRASVTNDAASGMLTLNVLANTMDTLFAIDPERYSFVKCDVEGHELACIRGARRFLAKSDACWLIEVSDNPDVAGSNACILFKEMTEQGFKAWWFDGSILHERKPGDTCLNYFFMKPHHIETLTKKAPGFFQQ